METQLKSFGNYLLSSIEDINKKRDIEKELIDWKEKFEDEEPLLSVSKYYPSRFGIGEKVGLCIVPKGVESFPNIPATITAVHFTISKVKYDLEINFYGDYTTRLHNIDSVLVVPFDSKFKNQN